MGLISSMLGGAARSGMAMADKIGTEKRENKKQEGLLSARNDREDLLLKNANDREDLLIKNKNTTTERRDKLQHKQAMTLAYVNKKGGSAKIDPRITQRVGVLTSLLKADNITPEQQKTFSSELDQLTKFGGSMAPPEKPDILSFDNKNRHKMDEPAPQPKHVLLKQQEDEAKQVADEEAARVSDERLSQIGNNLQRKTPHNPNTMPSQVEEERYMAESIIRKIESGHTVSRQDIDLLRMYNVPNEIMLKARATF